MLAMKPNVNVDAQSKDPISYQKLENLAQKLSAIFLKYPALYNTYVNIHCKNSDIYRLNTEGIKQKACNGYAEISVHANVRTSSGSTLNDRYYRMVTSDKELDEAALIADIEKFAERLMEVKQATPLNDFYIGPVLFEGDAVAKAVANYIYPIIVSYRSVQENSSMGSLVWGKRIIDKKLSLTQRGDLANYKGMGLLGYYQNDADGLKPQANLPIIKNGILEHLICGRTPSINCMETTANDRFYTDPTNVIGTDAVPGVVALTGTGSMSMNKMKQAFLKEAKAQGLTTAYIVREPAGFSSCLYKVDVKTGAEQMVLVQDIPQLGKSDFMHILGASSDENVLNTVRKAVGTTVIAPRAMIVESIEKYLKKPKTDKPFPVENPLEK